MKWLRAEIMKELKNILNEMKRQQSKMIRIEGQGADSSAPHKTPNTIIYKQALTPQELEQTKSQTRTKKLAKIGAETKRKNKKQENKSIKLGIAF